MSHKFSRKGKNPGLIDSWLDSLGYYRKNIAYDETCLFRAASEQIYYSQMHHEKMRLKCVEYGQKKFHEFSNLVEKEIDWYDHVEKLKIHMVVCDKIEINIISKLYKVDVLIFNGILMQIEEIRHEESTRTLFLCKTSEDHYDVVYKTEYIMTAGFCQSIVYNILYENVFQIENVSAIVNSMLYDKTNFMLSISNNYNLNGEKGDEGERLNEIENEQEANYKFNRGMTEYLIAPFPFKVAKALDPTIYRNIEYDTWIEVRRELRLGDWYNGDNKLILGTRCVMRINDQEFSCYIQQHIKNENRCVVYVTSRAEFRTVLYTDLKAENDAKPWPLPYRFAKNVSHPPLLQFPNKELRNAKKRKDKKPRNNSSSESSTNSLNITASSSEIKATAYKGCPLQMKDDNESQATTSQVEHSVESQQGEAQWMSEWGSASQSQELPSWPESPNNSQSPYSLKHSLSAFKYPDSAQNFHYYYNCPSTSYSSQSWSSAPDPPLSDMSGVSYLPSDNTEEIHSQVQNSPTESYSSHTNYYYYHPSAFLSPTSPVVPTLVTPTTPQMDYYPFMYHSSPHPTTPVYCIPPPPANHSPLPPPVPDMMVPLSPLAVYTPPADVQYMPPQYVPSTPFVFPAPRTPQPTWYVPNTTQGCGFPTPFPTKNGVPN